LELRTDRKFLSKPAPYPDVVFTKKDPVRPFPRPYERFGGDFASVGSTDHRMADTLTGERIDQVARIPDEQVSVTAQNTPPAGERKAQALDAPCVGRLFEPFLQPWVFGEQRPKHGLQVQPAIAYHVGPEPETHVGPTTWQGKDPQISGEKLFEEDEFDETIRVQPLDILEIGAYARTMMARLQFKPRNVAREVRIGPVRSDH